MHARANVVYVGQQCFAAVQPRSLTLLRAVGLAAVIEATVINAESHIYSHRPGNT